MKRSRNSLLITSVVFSLFCASGMAAGLPGAGDDAGKTVVYRDTWGVPHIYAPTIEAGFYAVGWAQAEDRPTELLRNFLRGMGELASVEGKDALESDQVALMFELYDQSKREISKCDPKVLALLEAYVRGINDYYEANPKDVPEWWAGREADVYMVMAFGRLFLQSWSFDDGFSDMKRAGIEPGNDRVQRGSNQWSVAPQRSAEGVPILCIDPHLGWLGASRFWEFRIHAGEQRGSGFGLPGHPFIGLGHNENVAWAMTTGGPDTADVYELTLDPDDPSKYLYDGEWREMTKREVTLKVKNGDPVNLTLLASHHGPIAAMRNGKAYAVKSSYGDAVRGHEAWYILNLAKDYKGIMEGLATQEVFPQNVMCADTSGNIYYQRTGRVPKRPTGYDWSRPVDGSTSATEWQGLHPTSDLLQVLNPPQGYMQNCNIPPDAMMVDSPFSIEKTLPYIFADLSHSSQRAGWSNQRGARAVEFLQADDSVTIEEALEYATDTELYGADRWIEVLRKADAKFGSEARANSDVAAALDETLSWNNRSDRDSKGALKYYYWRKQLVSDHGRDAVASAARRIDNYLGSLGVPDLPIALSDEEYRSALTSFVNAMETMTNDLGSLDKEYGDVFRVGRGRKSWPVGGGGDFSTTAFRNISFGEERPDHTRWGRAGQTSTEIVVLSKPIKSWTYAPLGQSDRPESPHYTDQAEKAFSPAKLKATWWTPEELSEHVESRAVLDAAK
ncbi:MAG: penicillin acylase family protein [Candidatus Hydrogenedentes bacterium]|nr:penicillin acylase family protein [Candidatus Hydrogenedentota bacterium]